MKLFTHKSQRLYLNNRKVYNFNITTVLIMCVKHSLKLPLDARYCAICLPPLGGTNLPQVRLGDRCPILKAATPLNLFIKSTWLSPDLERFSDRRMRQALRFVVLLLVVQVVMAGLLGGKKDLGNVNNDLEAEELAKYAVNQYNSQSNSVAPLSFSKVISAKSQVVQGTMYHLKIEAHQGDQAKHWDARVWVKPWENFKKLEEFKAASPSASSDGTLNSDPSPSRRRIFAVRSL